MSLHGDNIEIVIAVNPTGDICQDQNYSYTACLNFCIPRALSFYVYHQDVVDNDDKNNI